MDIQIPESTYEIIVDSEDLLGLYNFNDAVKQIELLNSLNYKGFNTWRLPTKKELNIMYNSREKIGGFDSVYYWSSTKYNDDGAWGQIFSNAWGQISIHKNNLHQVRTVRNK